MTNYNHNYHLVNYRPWPITGAIGVIIILAGTTKLFNKNNIELFLLGILIIILIIYVWWRDISREGTFQGFHTNQVLLGLKIGILLFIISEFFFFLSFFWRFFHRRLSPTIELGLSWPPVGIEIFDAFKIPLLNTIILISSGISVTWRHHRLINKNYTHTFIRLIITIFLGLYFSILQLFEYIEAPFNISDSIYGSTFFIATGFHGIHVLIGTIFLIICLLRHKNFHFSNIHHFGFEAAAWYWHFVDIIWLFLYISIYWWGR